MSVRAALDMHAFTIELSSLRHSVLCQEKLTSQEPFSSSAAAKEERKQSGKQHFHFNNSFSNVNHFSRGGRKKWLSDALRFSFQRVRKEQNKTTNMLLKQICALVWIRLATAYVVISNNWTAITQKFTAFIWKSFIYLKPSQILKSLFVHCL